MTSLSIKSDGNFLAIIFIKLSIVFESQSLPLL